MAAWPTRLATPVDAAELVRLRRLMFEAMGIAAGDAGWETACAGRLTDGLRAGAFVGAVIDAPGGAPRLAASGIVTVEERLPGPTLPAGRSASIGSMSTDPRWQRRGMASAVLQRCLREIAARGLERVELYATAAGEEMYRRAGFVDRPDGRGMRLATPAR